MERTEDAYLFLKMSEPLQNKGEHNIILFQSFNIMIVYHKNTIIMNLV